MYLHSKNRSVAFQKHRKLFCFYHLRVFTRGCFQNVPVIVPFSKSTVFEICRQKMCRFRVNGSTIRHIFHCFQNVPASCERCLRPSILLTNPIKIYLQSLKKSSITYVMVHESFLIPTCGICFAKPSAAVLTRPRSTVILRNNKSAFLRLVQSGRVWRGTM